MAMTRKLDSLKTFDNLASRQGGSFFLNEDKSYISYDTGYTSLARSLRTKKGLLFKFSIFNYYENKEEVELGLLINPTDITIGQSFVASNSYTRQSLLSTLWGSQQQTISCAGTSPAFFIGADTRVAGKLLRSGLTTAHRKDTLGFINFLSLVAMYKNNGNYFLDGDKNSSLYNNKSGYGNTGRVIGVMDSILLSYDGSEYVGSFNAFTLDEDPARPFNLRYNFEFVVSCMRGDAMDGHLRMRGNNLRSSDEPQIPISIQGRNVTLTTTVGMSTKDLNDIFKISEDKFAQTFEEYLEGKEIAAGESSGDSSGSQDNDLSSGGVANVGAQAGVGSKYTGKNGKPRYVVTAAGQTIGGVSGDQLLANISNSGIGNFSVHSTSTIIKLYDQKCNKKGQTYAQFIEGAAGKIPGFTLDPMLMTTILTVEAGSHIAMKNGVAVPGTNVKGDYRDGEYHSLGITQIYDTTFNGLAADAGYQNYMKSLNFGIPSQLVHDRCRTDPLFAIATSIYLINQNSKLPWVGNDSKKAIIAYNAGIGYGDDNNIPAETAKYMNTYKALAQNQGIATSVNKIF